MNAIDIIRNPLVWNAWETTPERMTAVEVKAAFVQLVEPFELRSATVARPGKIVDPIEESTNLYGPALRRRLDARWSAIATQINEAFVSVCGYELAELTSCSAIERCMSLVGAHPTLYPALMKLWRLQGCAS